MSVSEYSSSDSQVSGESPEFNSSDSPTHVPSHYVDPKTTGKPKLRQKLIKSRIFNKNIPFLFHYFNSIRASSTISTADNDIAHDDCTINNLVTQRMERRLIHWRPPVNSTSIEDSLNGNHPFQLLKDNESNRKHSAREETTRGKVSDNSNNLKLLHSNSTLNLIQRLQDLKNNNHDDDCFNEDTDTSNGDDIYTGNELYYGTDALFNNNSSSVYKVCNEDTNNYENANLINSAHIAPPLDLAKFYSSNLSRPTSSSTSSTQSMDCFFCCPLII